VVFGGRPVADRAGQGALHPDAIHDEQTMSGRRALNDSSRPLNARLSTARSHHPQSREASVTALPTEESMHNNILYRLTRLAEALSLGHHRTTCSATTWSAGQ
jgi:hypothetical protein